MSCLISWKVIKQRNFYFLGVFLDGFVLLLFFVSKVCVFSKIVEFVSRKINFLTNSTWGLIVMTIINYISLSDGALLYINAVNTLLIYIICFCFQACSICFDKKKFYFPLRFIFFLCTEILKFSLCLMLFKWFLIMKN
jgi:hypothetical protein